MTCRSVSDFTIGEGRFSAVDRLAIDLVKVMERNLRGTDSQGIEFDVGPSKGKPGVTIYRFNPDDPRNGEPLIDLILDGKSVTIRAVVERIGPYRVEVYIEEAYRRQFDESSSLS